jgi:hypothetical protein
MWTSKLQYACTSRTASIYQTNVKKQTFFIYTTKSLQLQKNPKSKNGISHGFPSSPLLSPTSTLIRATPKFKSFYTPTPSVKLLPTSPTPLVKFSEVGCAMDLIKWHWRSDWWSSIGAWKHVRKRDNQVAHGLARSSLTLVQSMYVLYVRRPSLVTWTS